MARVTFVDSREKAVEAYRSFQRSRFDHPELLLSFDTETTGLNVRSPGGDTVRTVQFSWRPWEEAVVFETTPEWANAIGAFFEFAGSVVGHNVRFDIHAMKEGDYSLYNDFDPELVHDTVWLSKLYDERMRAQLKPLSDKYLGADSSTSQANLKRLMTKNDWTWATVPVKYLVEYGGLDAIFTGQLFDIFYPRVAEYALPAYRREQRLSKVLYGMEHVGMRLDTDLFESTKQTIELAKDEARDDLEAIAPGMNPNAPHQVKQALRERGLDLPNTQAATLKAHADNPLIASLLRFRDATKVFQYLEKWTELQTEQGTIHPSFNQLGAATGRFSMSDPNLQNIKRGHVLRNIFIAKPGHKLVVADWNQMELRLYAHFAADENMRAAFLSDDDIYQQVADLLGVPRQIGKMIMLASVYGAGAKALRAQCIAQSYQFGNPEIVPELEGYDWEALHKQFHKQYRIKRLAESTELAARKRGYFGDSYIKTLGGRRQRPKSVLLPDVNGHRQRVYIYKDLANSLVQGSAADLMKMALLDVDYEFPGMLRLTVHDEMVLEVPDGLVDEVQRTIVGLMTRNEFIPPLTVTASAAVRYGDAK